MSRMKMLKEEHGVGEEAEQITLDLVLLLSGGLDSALLLKIARTHGYHPIALLIDYGQKHRRELETAITFAEQHDVPWRRATINLPEVSSGLTGSLVGGQYAGVHEAHVPGRNTFFVGIAASLAESLGIRKIWYGANGEDRINLFPDCYQEWIVAMNKALAISGSFPIELEAPLLGMRKTTIEALALHLYDLRPVDVHSGYDE